MKQLDKPLKKIETARPVKLNERRTSHASHIMTLQCFQIYYQSHMVLQLHHHCMMDVLQLKIKLNFDLLQMYSWRNYNNKLLTSVSEKKASVFVCIVLIESMLLSSLFLVNLSFQFKYLFDHASFPGAFLIVFFLQSKNVLSLVSSCDHNEQNSPSVVVPEKIEYINDLHIDNTSSQQ